MIRNLKLTVVLTVVVAAMLTLGCTPGEKNGETPSKPDAKPAPAAAQGKNPVVVIETSMGAIKAELWPDKSPKTVANFLRYVDEKFFDDLVFHRVMAGFMIQGGGFTREMQEKPAHDPVKNEARADVPNDRGTLAMARTDDVDSATAQFYINLVDNTALNHRDDSPGGFGYCAFGKVVAGMSVVDAIGKVATTTLSGHKDVPVEPVIIKSIRRLN
jgi:cyclophilin family peptidyl-prolyl cis-trans isomerase